MQLLIIGTLRIYDGDGDGENDTYLVNMCQFYFTLKFLIYLALFSEPRMRSVPNRNIKKSLVVHGLQTTQKVVISCCCFAADGKEKYHVLQCTSKALFCSSNLVS